jgi:hypothetical protein
MRPRRSTALGVAHETQGRLRAPHARPPVYDYAKGRRAEGFKVIIAGAGGAAHLPGMTASMTRLPVLGVPVESKALSGRTACCRSCRCRAAFPSARWRSARPARSMRRCSRRRFWPSRRRVWPTGLTRGASARPRRSRSTPWTTYERPSRQRSASWAAASSAACWPWRRPISAIRTHIFAPEASAAPPRRRGRWTQAPMRTGALARFRRAGRRRHL